MTVVQGNKKHIHICIKISLFPEKELNVCAAEIVNCGGVIGLPYYVSMPQVTLFQIFLQANANTLMYRNITSDPILKAMYT